MIDMDLGEEARAPMPGEAADRSCWDAARMVLEQVPLVTAVVDEDCTVADANDLFLEFVDAHGVEEVRGRRMGALCRCVYCVDGINCGRYEECARCDLRGAIERAVERRSVSEMLFVRRRNGGIHPQSIAVTTYTLALGGRKRTVVHLDNSGNRLLREALERIFLHDALNSVSGIQGLATTLRAGEREKKAALLDVIVSYARELAEEIKFYRCLRDAEHGLLAPEVDVVDSSALMRQVAELSTHLGENRDKRVAFEMEACQAAVRTDRRLLKRVLGNLLKNAFEASRDGGFVVFRCMADDRSLVFSVYNDGCIPRDLRRDMFKGIVSSKGGGRGLGLFGVKLLVEQYLGGAVSYSSSEEEGTWFHVRIPLEDE